ncbi:MAG: hypothetical protein ACJZ59_02625 [Candidatus Thalassarchaeaceae archaeon]
MQVTQQRHGWTVEKGQYPYISLRSTTRAHWNVHYVIPTSEGHEVGDHPESMSDPDRPRRQRGTEYGITRGERC